MADLSKKNQATDFLITSKTCQGSVQSTRRSTPSITLLVAESAPLMKSTWVCGETALNDFASDQSCTSSRVPSSIRTAATRLCRQIATA